MSSAKNVHTKKGEKMLKSEQVGMKPDFRNVCQNSLKF